MSSESNLNRFAMFLVGRFSFIDYNCRTKTTMEVKRDTQQKGLHDRDRK